MIASNKKRIVTEQTKKKISDSLKGFKHSKEMKEKMSKTHTGMIYSEAHREAIFFWKIKSLNEPFKFLSKDLLPRGAELLASLSKKLNLQFIIVTHLDELTECADKVFNVKLKKGISSVL